MTRLDVLTKLETSHATPFSRYCSYGFFTLRIVADGYSVLRFVTHTAVDMLMIHICTTGLDHHDSSPPSTPSPLLVHRATPTLHPLQSPRNPSLPPSLPPLSSLI